VLCQQTKSVTLVNGLFNSTLDTCSAAVISGQQLYLGMWVQGEPAEMTPRQPLYPSAYAFSLAPGAIVSQPAELPALQLKNTGAGAALSLQAGGGAFIQAAGAGESQDRFRVDSTGSVWSAAASQISLSPLNAFSLGSNLIITKKSAGFIEVHALLGGLETLVLPVDVPLQIYGVPQKLKSIRVCYQLDSSLSSIASTSVRLTGETGDSTPIFSDANSQDTSPDWTCYDAAPSVPATLDGALLVQWQLFFMYPSDVIRIGKIALTLTEQ
jgi:hypothetical protein